MARATCFPTAAGRFAILAGLLVAFPAGAADEAPPDAALREVIHDLVKGATRTPPAPIAVKDPAVGEGLNKWMSANAPSVEGVRPSPLPEQPWGLCTYRPASGSKPAVLYLHVFDWHAGGKLTVYGLAGGVSRASLLGDPNRAKLDVSKTDRNTILAVPKQAPDPVDTVVVLELEGKPKVVPLTVRATRNSELLLHARDAIVHGRTVRYEPEPHKNTVGYWMDPADWVSWEFEVARPGRYAVEILQGCGKGSGGSTVEFRAGDQTLNVTVQDTGGFQNFVPRNIGDFTFDRAGTYTLEVKPRKKPGAAVMDLRQVTLTPKTAG